MAFPKKQSAVAPRDLVDRPIDARHLESGELRARLPRLWFGKAGDFASMVFGDHHVVFGELDGVAVSRGQHASAVDGCHPQLFD